MNNRFRRGADHTDKRFGKLKVVGYSHTIKYKSGNANNYWNCVCDCGSRVVTKSSSLVSARKTSCGCSRISRRKGGKIKSNGYRSIYCKNSRKYILEHRVIWEDYYRVKLKPHQNIHHINGDRLDNRIENLELWDTSQPKGQRIKDKIEYALSILEEYRNYPSNGLV
jgi:hypothetical protein